MEKCRSYLKKHSYITVIMFLPGVCGVGSCVRRGGVIEDDDCCDKTAYDWVYDDPLKPACVSAPRNVPCHSSTTLVPTNTPLTPTSCPSSMLCELLDHP